MKKIPIMIIVILSLLGSSSGWATYQVPSGPVTQVPQDVMRLQAAFSDVADLVKPAVVSITTVHVEEVPEAPQFYFGDPFEQFFGQFYGQQGNPYGRQPRAPHNREFKMEGMGSGVIIDPSGLVLTNEHVVHQADEIKVLLYDKDGNKTEYSGKVVGKDVRTDIAVVRIRAGHKLPFASLGDSEKVRVGDWAIAIGSPFGLSQTFTVGVISAARQSLDIEDREYHNLIQTDAAINRGNSGGPLLNIKGEVVGINTAIYAPTGVFAGIGFAIPINQAKSILDELVEKGHVTRGWLGVELAHEITPAMVKNFGLSSKKGALINSVMKNSPAQKAGLKRGDIVLSYNGKAVESADALQNLVSQTSPKKRVDLVILREKKKMNISLALAERPEAVDQTPQEGQSPQEEGGKTQKEKTWLGAHVTTFSSDQAAQFQQPQDAEGVVVTDVDGASAAEDMGLMVGDIIRGVNQMPTPDVASFSKATAKVSLSEGVVLDVLRQGRPMYLSYTKPEKQNQ